ncbi:hypothetical protein [Sorangium sp. So ce341]|uniref:hypothetical protein n=1 Tax=Sorangium sp. So ce341 TaxID=3133302 RepID=UPI003F63EEA9
MLSVLARLRSAQGRIGRVLSPGGAGGITIKSTLDGVVSTCGRKSLESGALAPKSAAAASP